MNSFFWNNPLNVSHNFSITRTKFIRQNKRCLCVSFEKKKSYVVVVNSTKNDNVVYSANLCAMWRSSVQCYFYQWRRKYKHNQFHIKFCWWVSKKKKKDFNNKKLTITVNQSPICSESFRVQNFLQILLRSQRSFDQIYNDGKHLDASMATSLFNNSHIDFRKYFV